MKWPHEPLEEDWKRGWVILGHLIVFYVLVQILLMPVMGALLVIGAWAGAIDATLEPWVSSLSALCILVTCGPIALTWSARCSGLLSAASRLEHEREVALEAAEIRARRAEASGDELAASGGKRPASPVTPT